MPTILRINGYRFFFYSNENDEPAHVHVEKGRRWQLHISGALIAASKTTSWILPLRT
jgi:Domain of unknown function (DUF4160)